MKVVLAAIGKTDEKYLEQGIDKYSKRINKYLQFDIEIIPDIKNTKNMNAAVQKEKEGELILKKIQQGDYVILLDENGKTYSSVGFAEQLNSIYVSGYKRLIFIIGGPYGFSNTVYNRCNSKISLSKMTFSHQLIRLIFVEQFYRAQTILKGEPYHHQ
jgi:23S rRNA (pseudouridine1915-N3)-methyltransferase